MNRTQYLTIPKSKRLNLSLWRYKNNHLEYFECGKKWNSSHYSLKGHGCWDIKTPWIKISRDEARKLEPKAFLNKKKYV